MNKYEEARESILAYLINRFQTRFNRAPTALEETELEQSITEDELRDAVRYERLQQEHDDFDF